MIFQYLSWIWTGYGQQVVYVVYEIPKIHESMKG